MIAAPPTNALTGQALPDAELKELTQLVEKLVKWEGEVARIEEALTAAKATLNQIQFTTLPEKMNSLGVQSIVLTNGQQLLVRKIYACSISDENPQMKQAAIAWLRQNGFDALIKSEIKVPLPKGNDKLTKKLRAWLEKQGLLFGQSEQVANPTAKSLMKQRIEEGKPFPLDIFRGFVGNKAEVTRPE